MFWEEKEITVKDILDKMENGACHVILIDSFTGEVILKTIWYNAIDEKYLGMQVLSVCVRDYELRLEIC